MTVYRVVPVFSNSGQVVGLESQQGEYHPASPVPVVSLPNGDVCSDRGWHWTPSEAWEACGTDLDHLAERLRLQAAACRARATEEACS